MIILYNCETKKWVQHGPEKISFGGLKAILPIDSKQEAQHIPFRLQLKDQHVGPLIGIMTAPKNEYSLAGNQNLFINIQRELLSRGALSFIFSYLDVLEDGKIVGYIYLPESQEWIRAMMPFPDIVYNRIPFRKSEKRTEFQDCIKWFQGYQIPIFNPGFINKYELYKVLASSKKLINYLPHTRLIDSKETLKLFFTEYKDIYLKPKMSSRGKNIFRLSGNFVLESKDYKNRYDNFEEFWHFFSEYFEEESFIAQPTIHTALTEENIRYDFRILSHWSETQQTYIVTGIGIRASNQHQLTTHLANGGFIIPYEKVQTPRHDSFIIALVKEVGNTLSKKLGFFGEFSIDAGVNSDGNYVIYEVNSKPMSFDETEIETNRIRNICDLFFQKTGFNE